jgi:hypothetical protein
MRKDVIPIGKIFSRYKVISEAGRNKCKQLMYKCLCDCGSIRFVPGYSLVCGHVKSCGCLARELSAAALTTHGKHGTPLYVVWAGMIQRCTNKNHRGYKSYGGRGISVCGKWKNSFAEFDKDMSAGYKKGLTIDRIDNDGDYCKENCRWITMQENYLNSSRIKHISINGITRPLYEWLSIYGTSRGVYANRVYKYGWTPERAIVTTGTSCL